MVGGDAYSQSTDQRKMGAGKAFPRFYNYTQGCSNIIASVGCSCKYAFKKIILQAVFIGFHVAVRSSL